MHTPAGKSSAQQRPRHTPGASPSLAHAAAASPSPVAPAVPSLTFSASKHARSMRAQKAAGTKQAHSRTLFKPALASPFNMPWNALSLEQSLQAIKILQEGLRSLSEQLSASASSAAAASSAATPAIPAAKPAVASASSSSQKRKRPAEASSAPIAASAAADDSSMTDDADDSAASSSSARPGLCLGINAVTRGLETSALSLVIVCRSVNPLALIAHLPVMCHLRQCRLLTLHPQINSRMLAQAIKHSTPRAHKDAAADATSSATIAAPATAGRQQKQGAQVCMALGIQVSTRVTPRSATRAHLASTVAALESFSTLPSLPWLTPVPVSYQPVKVLHTDVQSQRPGKQPQQQQQQQQKSKQQAGAGAAEKTKNATTAAPQPPSASLHPAAAKSSAGAAAASPASAAAAAPKQRVESATQRRKKQKVEQQQQRAQTPPGQA